MSSEFLKLLVKPRTKHAVGELNNWGVDVINLGAIATADMDNYTVVELGFNADGERTCSPLTDKANKGYLLASVEDYLGEFETISSFFVGKDEKARIVRFVEGKRFATTGYSLNDSAKPVKEGQVAHFDVTTKKYIISNGTTNHADYADSKLKLVVVKADANTIDGLQKVRFEVVEA